MWTRFAVALAFVLTACVGSFVVPPMSRTSATPTPTATAMLAGNPTPGASAQASATPQIATSSGPSVAPSTAKTVEPLKSPTPRPTSKPSPTPAPVPTPTPRPKTLWTHVVPGVEVMDESVLEFPDANGILIKPRMVSGVAVHIGGQWTTPDGTKELWIQFNDVGGKPGFVAYDLAVATWSVRVSTLKLRCPNYFGDPCHPDDYPLLVNQFSDDNWVSTFIVTTPIVTAQSSQSFTVEMHSQRRWYGGAYTRIIDKSLIQTVPITEDFYRVLIAPDYYTYGNYKDERGVAVAGHSAWHGERLYYATMYRAWNTELPRVLAWWSKSDNSWRVTELPFAKNDDGSLRYGQPLYMAIDPGSGTFFFIVPEHQFGDMKPWRLWGTLYKVSASFIHDNGVLVSVK